MSLTSHRLLTRTLHIREPVQLTFDLNKLQLLHHAQIHRTTAKRSRIADLLKAPKTVKTESLFSAFLVLPKVILTYAVDDMKYIMALQQNVKVTSIL